MDFKAIGSNILAGFLGFIIAGALFNILQAVLIFIYRLIIGPEALKYINHVIYTLFVLFASGFAIYLGLRCYKKRNLYFSIFKPVKWNWMISFILAVIMVLFSIALSNGRGFVHIITKELVPYPIGIPWLTTGLFFLFYPFVALCCFTWKFTGKKQIRNSW